MAETPDGVPTFDQNIFTYQVLCLLVLWLFELHFLKEKNNMDEWGNYEFRQNVAKIWYTDYVFATKPKQLESESKKWFSQIS